MCEALLHLPCDVALGLLDQPALVIAHALLNFFWEVRAPIPLHSIRRICSVAGIRMLGPYEALRVVEVEVPLTRFRCPIRAHKCSTLLQTCT